MKKLLICLTLLTISILLYIRIDIEAKKYSNYGVVVDKEWHIYYYDTNKGIENNSGNDDTYIYTKADLTRRKIFFKEFFTVWVKYQGSINEFSVDENTFYKVDPGKKVNVYLDENGYPTKISPISKGILQQR